MPILFLLLWSSSIFFIKAGLNYTTPFVLLSLRLFLSTLVLTTIVFVIRSRWPSKKELGYLFITSLFSQVLYAGSLILALNENVSPGLIILIIGAQPVLTTVISIIVFEEKTSLPIWIGLFLGFSGLALVVVHTLFAGIISPMGAGLSLLALLGLTAGTVLQKHLCSHINLFNGTAIQSLVGGIIFLILALSFESLKIQWTWQLAGIIAYLGLAVSVTAVCLLHTMIERGKLIQVGSIFYIMPPLTAILDYFILGNTLTYISLLGMSIIMIGVFLVNRANLRMFVSPNFKDIS